MHYKSKKKLAFLLKPFYVIQRWFSSTDYVNVCVVSLSQTTQCLCCVRRVGHFLENKIIMQISIQKKSFVGHIGRKYKQ